MRRSDDPFRQVPKTYPPITVAVGSVRFNFRSIVLFSILRPRTYGNNVTILLSRITQHGPRRRLFVSRSSIIPRDGSDNSAGILDYEPSGAHKSVRRRRFIFFFLIVINAITAVRRRRRRRRTPRKSRII